MGKYIFNGYDKYEVMGVYGSNFIQGNHGYRLERIYNYGNGDKILFPAPKELLNSCNKVVLDIEEHPELLDTAKKLYIHPCCEISRETVSRKYKRCLKMATADAVIIPKDNYCKDVMEHAAMFINDDDKMIIYTSFWSGEDAYMDAYDKLCAKPMGTKLIDCINLAKREYLVSYYPKAANAELAFTGTIAEFSTKQKHLIDYASYLLPKDKLVFEDTLMKDLSDETNIPTFDSMMSVYEMLESKEDSIRDLGLKTLAAMDYSNYPKSTTYILKKTAWQYTKARNSTAVKYMLKTLGIQNTSYQRYVGYKDRFITEKDYALAEQLIKKIENLDKVGYLRYCYDLPFVWIDDNFNIHPNIPA